MLASYADVYGTSAKRVTNIQDAKTAGSASGHIRATVMEKKAPVYGLISLILLLVAIRLVWEMI